MQGIEGMPYLVGAAVVDYDRENVEILGSLDDGTPVLGLIRSNKATIFFCGDTKPWSWYRNPWSTTCWRGRRVLTDERRVTNARVRVRWPGASVLENVAPL